MTIFPVILSKAKNLRVYILDLINNSERNYD